MDKNENKSNVDIKCGQSTRRQSSAVVRRVDDLLAHLISRGLDHQTSRSVFLPVVAVDGSRWQSVAVGLNGARAERERAEREEAS